MVFYKKWRSKKTMIIELLKHSLNFGENFEYINTYILSDSLMESKKSKNIEDLRILVRGIKSKKEIILYLEKMEGFAGKDRYQIGYIDNDQITHISKNHIKNTLIKEYDGIEHTTYFNYWKKGNNPRYLEYMLSAWIKSDPLIHNGDMTHSFLSVINNYRGSYKFNKKVY